MESAIPPSLRCPRSRPQSKPLDWNPPYPAWASNALPDVERLVIGYFGVQWQGDAMFARAMVSAETIWASFALEDGPVFFEKAQGVDAEGYETLVAIAYWNDERRYARWHASPAVSDWWAAPERETEGPGLFREILSPGIAQFEALFSAPGQSEGAANLLGGQSADVVEEHAYWGSMRDRIPLAQTDALEPDGALLQAPAHGARVTVNGHDCVALIRSGQEWARTTGRERDIYLGKVEPVLRAGMDYLSVQGRDIGCYANRYLRMLGERNEPVEKSFGMSVWRSLSALEEWAASHSTHLAIFGTFQQMAFDLDFQLDLRLYHEVCVLRPEEQYYEYISCHVRTGLMTW